MPSYDNTASETITVTDYERIDIGVLLQETLTATTPVTANVGKVIRDFVEFTALLQPYCHGSITVDERFMSWDAPKAARAYLHLLGETATLGETVSLPALVKFLTVMEYMGTLDEALSNFRGTATLGDTLSSSDSAQSARGALRLLAESLSIGDTSVLSGIITLALLADSATISEATKGGIGKLLSEILQQHDALSSNAKATITLQEQVELFTQIFSISGAGALIEDSVSFGEDALYLFALACLAADSIATEDTAAVERHTLPECNSTLTITPTVSTVAALNNSLTDILSFSFTVTINGDVYQGWSFTGNSMLPSLYTNFQFNSFATLPDDRVFGCKSDGIYLLGGEDDAGARIESGVRLNYFNFGTQRYTSLYYAYFGLVGDDPVLKVITEDFENTYYVINGTARLPQGLKSRTWELVLADIDALDFVEVTPIILHRR